MAIATIPRPQPSAVIVLPTTDGGAPPSPAGVTPSEAPIPPATAYAGSALPLGTWALAYGAALAIAAVAYLAAYFWLLPGCQRSSPACSPNEVFRVSSDFSVFAGLFVLALAVERVLQPLTRFIGPDTDKAKDERDKAQKAAVDNPTGAAANGTGTNAQWLAKAQADVDRARKIGEIVHWGVAVAISLLLAGKLNALLLSAIAAEGSARPAPWADLLVTGLVIGAGTKPLHDLVAQIQTSKENKQDPVTTGGSA